ncbi:MAG: response regulator [Candidatus Omnitrophica bacterium]|nr:response regulator [Candidatus Omnitrophota bacterium]
MKKKKILVIDDEEKTAELVKIQLELSGEYEVMIETRGSHGLSAAQKFKPDLILLDIIMPGRNGFKVLEDLKKDAKTMPIPVIMLTSLDDMQAKIKAAQQYNEGYLVKPVTKEALKAKIEEIFKMREGK